MIERIIGKAWRGAGVPALLALLMLAGCGRRGPAAVELRFWNGFTGPDGRTMLKIVREFNAAQPRIRVVMQRMDWATYYNKLFVAGLSGRAPDVFVVHTDNMLRLARAGGVRPVDDLVRGVRLAADDIDAVAWEGVTVDGRRYGVPLDIHPWGLYYNKRLFRAAGLTNALGAISVPHDRATFLAAARRLTQATHGGGITNQWGFVITHLRTLGYTLMCQYGGGLEPDAGGDCRIDRLENVAALQCMVDLVQREHVAPMPQLLDAWTGFRQGTVGMVCEGIYMLADLEKQDDLEYGAAPMPQVGTEAAVWGNSHNLCVGTGVDGARLTAAWEFISYLSDHSLAWARAGQVPVRRSQRASPAFTNLWAQHAFARGIAQVRYSPRILTVFELWNEVDYALERAVRGSATPQAALARAQRNYLAARARLRQQEAQP
jgi:multiple sugar transport system substrate-binding protein